MDLVEDYTFLQKIYADLNNDDLRFELFIRTLFQQRNSCLSDPESCIKWLTKVLANGKSVLENI